MKHFRFFGLLLAISCSSCTLDFHNINIHQKLHELHYNIKAGSSSLSPHVIDHFSSPENVTSRPLKNIWASEYTIPGKKSRKKPKIMAMI